MIKVLNTINTRLIPISVLQDVKSRISDWLASGGKETDPYIQRQIDYLKAVKKQHWMRKISYKWNWRR